MSGERATDLGRHLRQLAPILAVLIFLALAVTPLLGQDAFSIVGKWGAYRDNDAGRNWLILEIKADSSFAMQRVFADSQGVHPVAGWVAPVVGKVSVQVIMGDRVACFKRDPEQALGTLNPPIFNGAHCSPVSFRREGRTRLLLIGDTQLFPVYDPADPADQPTTNDS